MIEIENSMSYPQWEKNKSSDEYITSFELQDWKKEQEF